MFEKVIKIGVWVLFFSLNVFAGKIDRAYEALNVFDYFKAKSIFEELLDKEPVAAPYGLSIIHFRNDNPFHDLALSYKYIVETEINYNKASEKSKNNLLNFFIDSTQISEHKNKIVLEYWKKAKSSKSVAEIKGFISSFPFFEDIELAKQMRNNLAFDVADSIGTFLSYREFYTSYPSDPRAKKAKLEYEQMLFEEKTANGGLQDYIDFVNIYPDNYFVSMAQNEIYKLSTQDKTISSYKWFVEKFPENHNVKKAYTNIFALSFTDVNDTEIRDFIKENKKFPYPEKLSEARVLRDLELHKISIRGKWGFVNSKGEIEIHPKYEFENDFSNELALVANEDFIGYINKKGDQVIDFNYDDGSDFIEGVAHVTNGDSVALINKLGYKVLDYNYTYISDAKDGVVLVKRKKDNEYLYYNLVGEKLFDGKMFNYAEVFDNGYAIVGDSLYFGVIDEKGTEVIKISNKRIIRSANNMFRVMDSKSKFGLVSLPLLDTIIEFKYNYIGDVSEGKYAVFTEKKYGYRNSDGSKLTSDRLLRFKQDTIVTKYKGGFAITSYRNKFGVIDSLGKKIYPNIFDKIGEVIAYPIPCSKRGKWGYITKKITMWSPYIYDYAGAFKNGVAIVSKNDKYGVIDTKRKNVIGFRYDLISEFDDKHYLAKENNFYGIIDKSGKEILPFYYSKIEIYKDGMLRLHLFGEYQYYDIKSNTFMYGVLPKKEVIKDVKLVD